MKEYLQESLLPRLLVPCLVVILLGISARPYALDESLRQAHSAMAEGRSLAAAHYLEQAARYMVGRPEQAPMLEQAGLLAMAGGDITSTLRSLTAAASLAPLSSQAQLALGDTYQSRGDLPSALRAWQSLPPSADVYMRMAAAHLIQKDYPALAEDWKGLLALRPNQPETSYRLGLLLAALQPEQAPAYLVQAASADKKYEAASNAIQASLTSARLEGSPEFTHVTLGRTLASLDEWELAAEAFRQATYDNPNYSEAWAFLGEALQRQAQTPGPDDQTGLAELEKAWQLDPKSVSANSFLAFYWQRHSQYNTALAYLKQAASADPNNPVLQVEIGNTLAAMGDAASAQEYFQNAIDMEPYNPLYWRLMAEFSINTRMQVHDLALPAARQAVLLAPNDPAALDLLGQSLFYLEDYASARRFLLRALQADPEYAAAHLHLGMTYLMTNDLPGSQAELQTVTRLAPGTVYAQTAQNLLNRFFP